MANHILEIHDLKAEINGLEILQGLSLKIKSGEIHAIMGPNGSGKSTLCNVLMGHPKYEVTDGTVTLDGEDVLEMATHERAHKGLFLAFQQPLEIPGVSFGNFLRLAKNAQMKSEDSTSRGINPGEFMKTLKGKVSDLKMEEGFVTRSINEGFSGGEKKRAEIIQMAIMQPKIALLDEIDSGLDIDALKTVAKGINKNMEETGCGMLIITHYQRILNYIDPHFVHIMNKGRIIKSGDNKLAHELEKNGYEPFIQA